MPASGYQIGELVRQVRRLWKAWLRHVPEPSADGGVTLSETARALSRPSFWERVPDYADPEEALDDAPLPERVAWELERRAGQFMSPPYEPPGNPPRLPRTGLGAAFARPSPAEVAAWAEAWDDHIEEEGDDDEADWPPTVSTKA